MKHFKTLPTPPPLGFLGHLKAFKQKDLHLQFYKWHQAYGELFRIRLATTNALVVANKALVRQILLERPNTFSRNKRIEKVFKEFKVNGVFSANGETWQFQRKFIESAFKVEYLKNFFPKLQIIVQRLINRFEYLSSTDQSVNMLDEFTRFTVDVTIYLVFGQDFNSIENGKSEFEKHLNCLFPGLQRRANAFIPTWRIYKTKIEKDYENAHQHIALMMTDFITKQKQLIAEQPELINAPENILQAMLAEQTRDQNFTDQIIFGNCFTLLLAGEDTTSNTLTWISYLLSEHNQEREILQQSIAQFTDDGLLDWPLPNIPQLNAVIYETMRLRSVAPIMGLHLDENKVINDYLIKKGTIVYLLLQASALEDKYYKDPQSFTPQRWLNGENKASLGNMNPFGGGKRICPGRQLAMMEIKLAICSLFRHYRLEPQQPASSVQQHLTITMSPVGFYCKVKKI